VNSDVVLSVTCELLMFIEKREEFIDICTVCVCL